MWGLSLKQMCTVPMPKRFPEYSRSVSAEDDWVLVLSSGLLAAFAQVSDITELFFFNFIDSLCQWRWEQKRARVSSGPAANWGEVQLHLPQGPRVHPHTLPLPHQLWGVHQTAVEHVQTTTCPGMPALPHQVPQRSHGQEGRHHCSMQRWAVSFT